MSNNPTQQSYLKIVDEYLLDETYKSLKNRRACKLNKLPLAITKQLITEKTLKNIREKYSHFQCSSYKSEMVKRSVVNHLISKYSQKTLAKKLKETIINYRPTYKIHHSKYENELEALFQRHVPPNGTTGTIEGEILRAIMKIAYRRYNDGDTIIEHCSGPLSAANYIERRVPGSRELIDKMKVPYSSAKSGTRGGVRYDNNLNRLMDLVYLYLKDIKKYTPSEDDYLNY